MQSRMGLLWATVVLSMPHPLSRRMMELGTIPEESNPLEDTLATTEELNVGQGNLAEGPELLATKQGRDIVQKYKKKLGEINRLAAKLGTRMTPAPRIPAARIIPPLLPEVVTEERKVERKTVQDALRKKSRELDDLLCVDTLLFFYDAAFAGPERVRDAILASAVGKRWGRDLATVVAQLVPAPGPQVAFF